MGQATAATKEDVDRINCTSLARDAEDWLSKAIKLMAEANHHLVTVLVDIDEVPTAAREQIRKAADLLGTTRNTLEEAEGAVSELSVQMHKDWRQAVPANPAPETALDPGNDDIPF